MDIDRNAVLSLWRDVLAGTVRSDSPDLSARQMAILTSVYLTPPPHTVRGLAEELNVGKPAVTRALDTLSSYNLLKRGRDPNDGRNVLVQRTVRGSVFLTELGDRIVDAWTQLAKTNVETAQRAMSDVSRRSETSAADEPGAEEAGGARSVA